MGLVWTMHAHSSRERKKSPTKDYSCQKFRPTLFFLSNGICGERSSDTNDRERKRKKKRKNEMKFDHDRKSNLGSFSIVPGTLTTHGCVPKDSVLQYHFEHGTWYSKNYNYTELKSER